MSMRIKRQLFAACAGVALAALAACGGATPSTPTKVSLTFWTGFTGGDRPAYESLIKQFNDGHPNIQVTMDVQPWDTIGQKLPAALGTGQGPDLATPDYNAGTIRQYAKSGLILALDDAYGSGDTKIDKGALPPKVVEGFQVNGKSYAVPANFATLLLYYNKDALAEVGLSGPPKTIQEFADDAVKLTKKDASGKVTRYGLALADHQTIQMWPILIWANGGDLTTKAGCSALTDSNTVSAMKTWGDLVVQKNISPVGATGQEADNLFAAKKAAMEMNGPWAAGQYGPAGVNFDVAPIPIGTGGPVTLASAVPIVVSKNTKNKDAAFQFLAWWTGKTAQGSLASQSGFPPARTDMAGDASIAKNPFVPKFAAAAPFARLYLPNLDKFNQVDSDVLTPAINKITRGESADTVLAAASKQMNTLIGGC
jgi:multiple sugar transport system substrate-binding protein